MKLDAASTLIQGLNKASNKAATAAKDLNAAFVANQKAVAAPSDKVEIGQAAAAADIAAVSEANVKAAAVGADVEGDVIKPLVDLLQAKSAYQANATALRVTADVESDVISMIGNRKDV
ncbi:MAG: hypothetical protein COY40_02690 [Alphaproteobacteria bacterium CG_4_10_14_0_8_um_filter_53_9]|nr:MAG: hypothetical protein COY40_02690 [Alphaproteobacteria bacterium CG_4_10_14_0_8_um_filter_53_9]